MGYWRLLTTPAQENGELTGTCSDDDRRFRLGILLRTLRTATAAAAEAESRFAAEIAAARRNGQQTIADEKLRQLAESRAA